MSSHKKNTTDMLADKKNVLDVYVAEWGMHVPAQQSYQERQSQIISLAITEVFVLVGFVGAVSEFAELNDAVTAALNCVLIPCVFMLMGGLWIDCVFRMMSLATYLYRIEQKVGEILKLNEDEIIGYEHHISRSNIGVAFVFRPNHWYYYICLFFFIFCPWATIAFHCFVLNKVWFDWCYITFGIYALFMLFMFFYCARIYQIKSKMQH